MMIEMMAPDQASLADERDDCAVAKSSSLDVMFVVRLLCAHSRLSFAPHPIPHRDGQLPCWCVRADVCEGGGVFLGVCDKRAANFFSALFSFLPPHNSAFLRTAAQQRQHHNTQKKKIRNQTSLPPWSSSLGRIF
jgi:hypothetical protein